MERLAAAIPCRMARGRASCAAAAMARAESGALGADQGASQPNFEGANTAVPAKLQKEKWI
jgi:hypothetical protein